MRLRMSMAVAASVVAAGAAMAAAAPAAMAAPQRAQLARSARTCDTGPLRYSFGARLGHFSQWRQLIKLTNEGWSTCSLWGFPGVTLVGKVPGGTDVRWTLQWQAASYSTVTLKPGKSAHFDLIYLPGEPGDGTNITVTRIEVFPPNDFRHAALRWDQSVLLQDGATFPGTYVSPVRPGG